MGVFHITCVYSTPQSAVFKITWMYSTSESDVIHITFNSESEGFNFARWDAAGARWGMRKWTICNIYLVLREHLYFLQRENLYLEEIKIVGTVKNIHSSMCPPHIDLPNCQIRKTFPVQKEVNFSLLRMNHCTLEVIRQK